MSGEFCSFQKSKSHRKEVEMYSPKIREDLVPRIYQQAKKSGVKMTVWVNAVIELALKKIDEAENDQQERRKKDGEGSN